MRERLNIIILVFVLLISIMFVSGEDFIEGIRVSSLDLVAFQDLSYSTCVLGSNVKTRVYCIDTMESIDLSAVDGGDNCYYSYVDLSAIPCSDLEIQSTYISDGVSRKLTKRLPLKKVLSNPNGILDKQEWDGGWNTPENTAYAIWILSDYSPKYDKQIEEGLSWLKDKRLEEEKCWPMVNGRCSIYETATTLLYLKYAGFNETEKIFQDGVKWLESQMNYIETGKWSFVLSPSRDDNCSVSFDSSTKKYAVVEDEDLEILFTPKYGMKINVTCDDISENVEFLDSDERFVNLPYDSEDEGRQYTIPDSCWSSLNKWDYCNRKTTLLSSLMTEIDEKKLDLAKEWITEELRSGSVVGKYLSTEDSIVDNALLLYDLDLDSDVLDEVEDWLIHAQNNDGSWGVNSSDKVKATGFSLLALNTRNFSGKNEVLNDGFSWLSANYPSNGWTDFSDEAISFLILRETAKSFLKADFAPVIMDSSSKTVNLENPTSFNLNSLTYSVVGSASSVIEPKGPTTMAAFGLGKLIVSKKDARAGLYSGNIIVKNGTLEVLSIPVILNEAIKLTITPVNDLFHFFSNTGKVKLRVTANSDFSCNVKSDSLGLNLQNSFEIKRSGVIELNAILNDLSQTSYSGIITCVSGKTEFEIPLDFDVKYYDVSPISLSKRLIKINEVGKNGSVTIKNNIDVPVSVDIAFKTESLYLTLGKRTVVIEPHESYKLDVINLAVLIGNETTIEEYNSLVLTSFDEENIVDVNLVIGKKSSSIFGKLFFLVIIFSILIGVWYYLEHVQKKGNSSDKKTESFKTKITNFRSELREILPDKFKKLVPKSKEEILREQKEMKADIQKSHLKDMVVVMKKLDKSEKEIKEKLLGEGLLMSEIEEILRQVNLDQKLQETLNVEEENLKIFQSLDKSADIRTNLKSQGFSESHIRDAFDEVEKSLLSKEDELKKKIIEGKK